MSEDCACAMLARDNARLKKAGGQLAIAAARVIHEYDGLHRMGLALADWHQAVADEGDRPFPPATSPDDDNAPACEAEERER